jgi:hypothetical protein
VIALQETLGVQGVDVPAYGLGSDAEMIGQGLDGGESRLPDHADHFGMALTDRDVPGSRVLTVGFAGRSVMHKFSFRFRKKNYVKCRFKKKNLAECNGSC